MFVITVLKLEEADSALLFDLVFISEHLGGFHFFAATP
jgi:hypothetical protein